MKPNINKMVRMLSCLAYLQASRLPVRANDVWREVEGYNGFATEGAFARRYYADRKELKRVGLDVHEHDPEWVSDEPVYSGGKAFSLSHEAFRMPRLDLSDGEIGVVRRMLELLEGRFAYEGVLRLAAERMVGYARSVAASDEGSANGRDLVSIELGPGGTPHALANVENAVGRGKTLCFDYVSPLGRLERRVVFDPYRVVLDRGQYVVVGRRERSSELQALYVSSIVTPSFPTRAERDFDPDAIGEALPYIDHRRPVWSWGTPHGTARLRIPKGVHRVARRRWGDAFGDVVGQDRADVLVETPCADPELLAAWVEGVGPPAAIVAIADRKGHPVRVPTRGKRDESREIKPGLVSPQRLSELLTLMGLLLNSGGRLPVGEVCRFMGCTRARLRRDVDALGIVNFGGGTYVLYVEISGDEVVVTPEVYAEYFTPPARLSPFELRVLLTAIDVMSPVLGSGLLSVRAKVVKAFGQEAAGRSMVSAPPSREEAGYMRLVLDAAPAQRALEIERYDRVRDEVRTLVIEPAGLVLEPGGWAIRVASDSDEAVTYPLDEIERIDRTDRAEGVGRAEPRVA